LIGVIVVCAIIIGVVFHGSNTTDDEYTRVGISETKENQYTKKSNDVPKENIESKKKESTAKESTVKTTPSNEFSEENFEFVYGKQNILTDPTYKRVDNTRYSFYYSVPTHFIKDTYEEIYYAPDKTAKMKVVLMSNDTGRSLSSVMNEYINGIGGDVTYSANGETWFALSITSNGNSYYIKGFVDHYVRAFIFSCPKEYVDIYSGYINYIEGNSKRTDV